MDANEVGHTGDSTLLRKVNKSAILALIQERGPLTRSELAHELRLSLSTITRIVSGLIESGLVFEFGSATSSGGRRPTLVDFNARANLIIGVYIGREMVGALADLDGEILGRCRAPSRKGEEGVAALIGLVQELCAKARSLGLPVRGVGIAAPSIVKQPEGVVSWAPALDWRDLPLRRRLEDALGIPTYVHNEINLIALGERWCGAGRGIDNLLCISLGEGIGAGIVIGGELYAGAHHAAGEIGYLVPEVRFLGRAYSRFGCLESEAGSEGMVRRADARLRAGEQSVLTPQIPLAAEDILKAARCGDAVATAVVSETVDYLALAITNLAAILDPERIVVTGELAEYGDLFLDAIRVRMRGLLPAMPEIVLSSLLMDAAVLGAVAVVLQYTSDALRVQASRA